MKKRILTMLFILVLALSLCACGKSSDDKETVEQEETLEEKIESQIVGQATIQLQIQYDVSSATVNVATIELSEDESEFDAYGKVTCTDKYGDKYEGKFSATGTVDSETEDISVDLDITTPTKVN